uniref:Interphotoreceptor matrix proteoglycan 1 n=1 Tax=Latimeria chalumnae TaxID=7897 RepID=H3ADG8_LATCH
NIIPEKPVEQVVEFSAILTNHDYTEELSDPNSPQYQDLVRNVHIQMQKVFEKLPGFKEIRVMGLRKKKSRTGLESAMVHYAVVFEKQASEVTSFGDDTLSIESDKTESKKSPHVLDDELKEKLGIMYTVTDLQEIIAMALQDDRSLIMDLGTFRLTEEIYTRPVSLENVNKPIVTSTSATEELDNALIAEYPLEYPGPLIIKQAENAFTLSASFEREELHLEDSNNEILLNEDKLEAEEDSPEDNKELDVSESHATAAVESFTSIMPSTAQPAAGDTVLEPEQDTFEGKNKMSTESPTLPSIHLIVTKPQDQKQTTIQSTKPLEKDVYIATSATEPPSEEHNKEQDDVQGKKQIDSIIRGGDEISLTYKNSTFSVEEANTLTSEPELPALSIYQTQSSFITSTKTTEIRSMVFGSSTEVLKVSKPLDINDDDFQTGVQNIAVELDKIDFISTETINEFDNKSGYTSLPEIQTIRTTLVPPLKYITTSSRTIAPVGKELVVFFRLRVTNMVFSDNLFNKSSPEYKMLEQRFKELLLPYLQSNLTGFKQLEILNFREGSVIVNSKMKFIKSVPYNISQAVYCVLEDFCNAAAKRLNLEIDSYSLDVEPADEADACKFMACNKFSKCVINRVIQDAACICQPGYISRDGLPCQSICEVQPGFCQNGEKCEVVPGRGAVCRYARGKFYPVLYV